MTMRQAVAVALRAEVEDALATADVLKTFATVEGGRDDYSVVIWADGKRKLALFCLQDWREFTQLNGIKHLKNGRV
jgi:hypothetical protein